MIVSLHPWYCQLLKPCIPFSLLPSKSLIIPLYNDTHEFDYKALESHWVFITVNGFLASPRDETVTFYRCYAVRITVRQWAKFSVKSTSCENCRTSKKIKRFEIGHVQLQNDGIDSPSLSSRRQSSLNRRSQLVVNLKHPKKNEFFFISTCWPQNSRCCLRVGFARNYFLRLSDECLATCYKIWTGLFLLLSIPFYPLFQISKFQKYLKYRF